MTKADTACPRCTHLVSAPHPRPSPSACALCWGRLMVPAGIASAYSIATLGLRHGINLKSTKAWLRIAEDVYAAQGCPTDWDVCDD